jgi:Skp family chaperone for outer membrane proteins
MKQSRLILDLAQHFNIKKIIKSIIFLLMVSICHNSFASEVNYLDLSKVLNTSVAGSKAKKELDKQINSTINKYKSQVEDIKKKEIALIAKKKNIKAEDYKKEIQILRKKVVEVNTQRQKELTRISKIQKKMRNDLVKALNPILIKYMSDNDVKLIVDKKNVLLGDISLEITSKILEMLNKELKSIKIQ